jgi:hypothetical protein
MSESERQVDKLTANTPPWRINGPMNAAQRKEAKALFIDSLKKDPTVSLACEAAHISRQAAYKWKDSDPTFAQEWADAVERTKDVARSSIYRRGILGWFEPALSMGQVVCELEPLLDSAGKPVIDKGKPVMMKGKPVMIHKWSDSLASLYAKANLPEYKDKPQVDLQVQLSDLADQAKEDLLADLSAALANEDKDAPH